MNIQNLFFILFLTLNFSYSVILNSNLKTKWSNWWKIQAPSGKVTVYASIADCDKNCKESKIDCLKISKWADQEAILKELKVSYLKDQAICYYQQKPVTAVSNFTKNKGTATSKFTGFSTLMKQHDICNSFCQTLYGRLCDWEVIGSSKGYGCRNI